jgi:hypothetical protein
MLCRFALLNHREATMRKLDATFIIAIAVAIAALSPASAKGAKSSSIFQHTVKGEHIKEGKIEVRKTSKPTNSDITVTKTIDKSSAK